jgi:16S rRNA (cytosine1402-N4)-methyltransferase
MQIDDAERGFSFMKEAPLDMRMSQSGRSAADIVNQADEAELTRILRDYGEERDARRIARAIIHSRGIAPITTTRRLAEIVSETVFSHGGMKIHPATRTFQALRIAVNDEIGELWRGLNAAENLLAPGGRLAVVTFHSLEDRPVKSFLQRRSGKTPAGSRHLPELGMARAPSFRLLTNKPLVAEPFEIRANPRSRSAKLRAAERTAAPSWPADQAWGEAA